MPGAAPSPPAQPTTWAMVPSPANSSSSSSSIEVSSALCVDRSHQIHADELRSPTRVRRESGPGILAGGQERIFIRSSPTMKWPCPVKCGKPSREAEHKLATALTPPPSASVKMEENAAGAAAARTGPATPMVGSPVVAQPLPTPPGDGVTRDQLLGSVDHVDGDHWLRTLLKNAADVVQKESSLLRQELGEARESEAAAKAELAKARKSEAAAKADLGKARAELGKVRKSEKAAKAELAKVRKSEEPVKAELVTTKAELNATKAELDKARKSEAATRAMFASAKAEVQKNFEDFVRLHSIMMESFGTDSNNVAPTNVNQTLIVQNQDSTRAHEESFPISSKRKKSHPQLTRL